MFGRKKNKEQEYQMPMEPQVRMVRHFYCTVDNGVQPCAPASQNVQMPTVVAPVAIVPYATSEQPVWQYETEY